MGDELLGQGIASRWRRWWASVAEKHLPQVGMLASVLEQRRQGEEVTKTDESYCKYFLVVAGLQRGCVSYFFSAALHSHSNTLVRIF